MGNAPHLHFTGGRPENKGASSQACEAGASVGQGVSQPPPVLGACSSIWTQQKFIESDVSFTHTTGSRASLLPLFYPLWERVLEAVGHSAEGKLLASLDSLPP